MGVLVIFYYFLVILVGVLEAHFREHLGVENMTKEERLEEVEEVISILKSDMK